MTPKELADLQDLIIDAVQTGDFPRARRLVESLAALSKQADDYRELLEKQKEQNRKLEEQLKEAEVPPLTRGVILGPSPDDERNVIIGHGGQRLEVRVGASTGLTPQSLPPGWEAWLSEDRHIVKVRQTATSGEVAEITSLLEDGRLELQGHGEQRTVVDRLSPLAGVELRVGDRVRYDPQLAVACERLPPQENKELELEEVPNVTYADIGGLDQHIEQIREAIELPYLFQHLFQQYHLRRPKGILLYGPPGCGKTMIAKAIANSLTSEIRRNLEDMGEGLSLLLRLQEGEEIDESFIVWRARAYRHAATPAADATRPERAEIEKTLLQFLVSRGIDTADPTEQRRQIQAKLQERTQAYFMTIKGPELLNKYVGETEHSIRKLFLQAKRRASAATPVIMFFDEIEALFRRRGSRLSSDVESTIVPQFLSEMDGVEELRDVIIIGATNRQDLLDPAILRPGRLDAKIKIDRPGRDSARSIFAKYIVQELPLAESEIAAAGSASAAIESLIERAVGVIFSDESQYNVSGQQVEGGAKALPCRQFISGAMIESVVSRNKRRALKREVATGEQGLRWSDLLESIREELEQNKDQLVATTLNLSEEGLTIMLCLPGADAGEPRHRWLRPLERPWAPPRSSRARRQAVAS